MEILARAVGRRKEAVAQVQLIRGNGQFIINDKPAQVYLQNNSCSLICIKAPLEAALSLFSNHPPGTNDSLTNSPNNRNISVESLLDGEQLVKTPSNEKNDLVNFSNNFDNLPIDNVASLNPSNGGQPLDLSFIASSESAKEGLDLSTGGGFTTSTLQGEIDIIIKVKGGGLIGQAEAIKLGVARAFCIMENSSGGALIRKILKTKGYLTQDSRVKERRKYGLKKARKASQYHKR